MLTNTVKKAVSIGVLAAFSFAADARQADTFDVLDVIEGYWGWVGPEGEEMTTCEDGGVQIWLSEDRQTYHSQYPGDFPQSTAPILRTEQSWFHIQYEGENRTTDAGETVSWVLFMTSRDRFVWIRHDWIGTGRTTYPLERCVSPNLT